MSSAVDPQGAAYPKLPLWHTIHLSYSTYFEHFHDVLGISWLWLVVAAPLAGVLNWLQFSRFAEAMTAVKAGAAGTLAFEGRTPIELLVLENVAALVLMLAGVSIAVAWHRRLILGEHPGFSGGNVATKSLWRYVWVGFGIALIAIVAALLIMLPMVALFFSFAAGASRRLPAPVVMVLVAVMVLLCFTVFGLMLRLSLLFPARAVGDVGLTFGATWRRTRGNTWRIFWGIMACTVPPIVAPQIVILSLVGFPFGAPVSEAFASRMAISGAIVAVWYLLVLPIGIGFLSISYWHFFKRT